GSMALPEGALGHQDLQVRPHKARSDRPCCVGAGRARPMVSRALRTRPGRGRDDRHTERPAGGQACDPTSCL
ncbi:MAG: hypothetical protein AVDCRST_MAG34-1796, partial [uncultured Nocardioidaceae bacterium]